MESYALLVGATLSAGTVLALAALGLALVAAGRAQATPDAAWLSALIQRALRAPPAAEAAATHHRNQAP